MAQYDVAIIGAGLGGLQCAYLLAKRGMKVAVIEKNHLLGGCLQTFKRGGVSFDTGFHYIGGLDEGQPLNTLFKKFNLMDLPWVRLDSDGFDNVIYDHKTYSYPIGFSAFKERFQEYFPDDKNDVATYTNFLESIANGIFNSFENAGEGNFNSEESLFARGAYDFLTSTVKNPVLRNALSGASPKLALNKAQLPLYTFAQINASFILSAYRIKGGGMQIAQSLANSIKGFGGDVFVDSEVTSLIENDNVVNTLEINNKELITASNIIVNVHPAKFVKLAENTSFVRKIYKKRILSLQNDFGMFTVNIKLKNNALKYSNSNYYIHEGGDVWDETNVPISELPKCCLVSFAVPPEGEYAQNVDLLTPMLWSDVAKFEGTKVMHRPDEYNELKIKRAEQLIDLADKYISGLKSAVDKYYTSTPLTYYDYTGTENGSAYGITKDFNRLTYTLLTPLSPIPNVYFTGQNLNLHGILGVSMTSLFTCAALLKEKPSLDLFGN